MKKSIQILLLLAITIFFKNSISAQTLAELEKKRVGLPNGWSLTPVGKNIQVGDLPLNLVVSNNKKWLAITNNLSHHRPLPTAACIRFAACKCAVKSGLEILNVSTVSSGVISIHGNRHRTG